MKEIKTKGGFMKKVLRVGNCSHQGGIRLLCGEAQHAEGQEGKSTDGEDL